MALVSFSAFAATEMISNPKLAGFYFAKKSNPDDVCKILGYESSTGFIADDVISDEGLRIIVGPQKKIVGSYYGISSVWLVECINKISEIDIEIKFLINPSLKTSYLNNYYYSLKSNLDGVCLKHGMKSSIPGSLIRGKYGAGSHYGEIVTDAKGSIQAFEYSGHYVEALACYSKAEESSKL